MSIRKDKSPMRDANQNPFLQVQVSVSDFGQSEAMLEDDRVKEDTSGAKIRSKQNSFETLGLKSNDKASS
jgi:hypothetical protein